MAQIPELSDQAQTRLAMAALFAALVRALEKRDVTSRQEVSAELEKIYHDMRDNYGHSPIAALETIQWAESILKS
jgi:hypothetical protein